MGVSVMKHTSHLLLAGLVVTSFLVFSAAARADWDLIVKLGAFQLSKDSQTVSGVGLTFDDTASGVLSIEGQYRMKPDLTLGGELLGYTNDWDSSIGSGDMDTGVLMFNIKKYFNTTKKVQPYIGGGVGFAATDLNGPGGTGTGSGLALQAMGGVELRFNKVGFYSELKWLGAKPEDEDGEKINVSGVGLFAGAAIHF